MRYPRPRYKIFLAAHKDPLLFNSHILPSLRSNTIMNFIILNQCSPDHNFVSVPLKVNNNSAFGTTANERMCVPFYYFPGAIASVAFAPLPNLTRCYIGFLSVFSAIHSWVEVLIQAPFPRVRGILKPISFVSVPNLREVQDGGLWGSKLL